MEGILSGKVALITGGSRGIGRAISKTLALNGAKVIINYLNNHDAANSLVDELAQQGASVEIIQAHIGDPTSRKELWDRFDTISDRLDFFIANAAIGVFKPLEQLSSNSFKKVLSINLESFLDLSHGAISRMKKKEKTYEGERGRIIAISSMGASRTIPDYGSVACIKAGVESMIRQYAFELGGEGINCNVVRAGLVDTGLLDYVSGKSDIISSTINSTPTGRMTTPEDVAGVVKFLLTRDSRMITGQTIVVDGGYSIKA